MKKRCPNCGGLFNRPGLYSCTDAPHPAPDLAQRIVAKIEHNLRDRRGMWPDDIDEETDCEIRDTLAKIIKNELTKGPA